MAASAGIGNEGANLQPGFAAHSPFLGSPESIWRGLVFGSSPRVGCIRALARGRYEPSPVPHAGPNAHSLEDLP